MSEQVKLTIFIVLAVLVGLAFLAWFCYGPIKKALWRIQSSKMFYAAVNKVARDGDFYLLNNLNLGEGGNGAIKINHIVGGDKFIYVITTHYYAGTLGVKSTDPSWVLYLKNGKKIDVPNPLLENKFALERLSIASGINTSFMVGIVLVNDDCFLNAYEADEGESLLVASSRLEKLIFLYEKKPGVGTFKKSELWQTIQDLHELGEKNRG